MRNKRFINFLNIIRKASTGIAASLLCVVLIVSLNNDVTLSESLLAETLPGYEVESQTGIFYKMIVESGNSANEFDVNDLVGKEALAAEEDNSLVNRKNVIYNQDETSSGFENHITPEPITIDDIEKLHDINYLRSNFYIIENTTDMVAQDFDAQAFLNADFKIDVNAELPQILIFHTHSDEFYADSNTNNLYDGVVGLGKELKRILEQKYGIKVLHDESRYDYTEGHSDRNGSYERMEVGVQKILKDNPSIEIAIDIHRDGVAEGVKLLSTIEGKQTAPIMFVNGLSKIYQKGRLVQLNNLPNPNLFSNLAFSFHAQLAANELYPGIARKIYLKGYRYSLHMLPKSLLVEIGAQSNTKQEAMNAIEPLADILAQVVLK